MARAAAQGVEDGVASGALRDLGFIVLYLVRDLSPGEMALLQALSRASRCAVVLGLTSEDGPDASVMALARLLESLLGPAERSTSTPVSGVPEHLLCAPDAQEEVRWIIRRIVRQAEDGLPFHRVAVAYRQADPYASLVPGQLRLAGIPVAGPDRRRLADAPPGKLLLGLLKALEADLSRDSVMHWLAESPVRLGADGVPASSELALWEVISRQAGVVKGAGQWRACLERFRCALDSDIGAADLNDEISPAQVEGLRTRALSAARLLELIQSVASLAPPQQGRWSVYAAWANDVFRTFALDAGQCPEDQHDAFDRVARRLDELAALDCVEPETDLAGFSRMIEESLDALAGRTGSTGSGVFVAPMANLLGMEFDTVYLAGMAEGAFPPSPPVDPLLPDQLREGVGLPSRQAVRHEERALFLAAMAAGEMRVLSYPRADSSAQRELYPSPWFLGEASRLHGSPVRSNEIGKLGEFVEFRGTPPETPGRGFGPLHPETPGGGSGPLHPEIPGGGPGPLHPARPGAISVIESAEQALGCVRSIGAADLHDYDVASVARWSAKRRGLGGHFLVSHSTALARALDLDRARRGSEFTEWDGKVGAAAGRSRRLAVGGVLSASRLEKWAKCPFGYYLTYVLKLSVLETPEEVTAISAMDRGTLVHCVLERLALESGEMGDLPDYGQPWSERHTGRLLAIAEDEFGQAEARGITGRALLWEVAKEEMRQDLMLFLVEDSRVRAEQGLRPHRVEFRFGFSQAGSLPPIELTLPGGVTLRFRGAVDRIDVDASGSRAVIIDYKSGSPFAYRDMVKDPLGKGKHLQLPIYALAVRAMMGSAIDVTAQYWFISSKAGFTRREVNLAEEEIRFRQVVAAIASGIQDGVFPANPGGSGKDQPENCGYCGFLRICPSDKDALWERKMLSTELAAYTDLIEEASCGEDEE